MVVVLGYATVGTFVSNGRSSDERSSEIQKIGTSTVPGTNLKSD